MIFFIHYILLTSGLSGASVLLGVFLKVYSDASQSEIGTLLMSFPFVAIIIKPLFCSMADRAQSHRIYLILSLLVMSLGYSLFVIIPFFPYFYTNHPRTSWYLLVVGCHIGCGGLNVAWSLGDTLAVNASQRTGTPFSRMRLMGTVSWGVYGYIIGQVNEVAFLPKYVPAFIILQLSVWAEILFLICWNKEDFVMFNSESEGTEKQAAKKLTEEDGYYFKSNALKRDIDVNSLGSAPGSLSGTLRLRAKTAGDLRHIIDADSFDQELKKLESRLKSCEQLQQQQQHQTIKHSKDNKEFTLTKLDTDLEKNNTKVEAKTKRSNPQILLFRMILSTDKRLVKYLIMFAMFGLLLAPMNFVFISMEEVCKERDCNFSQLAGSVLISQATIESICFFVLPWILNRISRSIALCFGLLILIMRYFFYANYYYSSNISPYWALVGEWGHGIAFSIAATIIADVALMFSNQSETFIPDLRKIGYLSNNGDLNTIRAEENSIKTAPRATMQALFGGAMDGLGRGVGSLICGLVTESYSYVALWHLFVAVSLTTSIVHQMVEVTKSKWSDTYKPASDSEALRVMNQNNVQSAKGVGMTDDGCKQTNTTTNG